MATVTEGNLRISRLSDPNIAYLASQAAIELDCMLRNKDKGTKAISELGNVLKTSTQHSSGTGEPAAVWDPAAISLIHNAIQAEGTKVVTSLDALLQQALEIANQLESTTTPSDQNSAISSGTVEAIKSLRSFCIGLANSAVAHERFQIESAFELGQWS